MKTFTTFFLLFTVLHHQYSECEANDIWNDKVRYAEGVKYHFVASISLKNYGHDRAIPVPICSGVLITKRYVLTLAHCINEVNDLKDVQVNLGYNDLKYTAEHSIKSWTTYKWWAKDNEMNIEQLEHDISILKLTKKVEWLIRPAEITKHSKDFFYGKQADTVIWGTYKQDRTAMVLRVAELDVISYKECMEELNNTQLMTKIHKVDKAYLCTNINLGAVLEDIDSGSPLVSKENELIAISDPTYLRRNDIHAPTNLNFYVGLDYYRTFIKNITETKCAKWWK